MVLLPGRNKRKQNNKPDPYTNFHNGLYFASTLNRKEIDLLSIPILGMNAPSFVDHGPDRLERQ